MSTTYESAKRVALGLEEQPAVVTGDDLWNISLDGGFGVAAEMPFQFFERGFDPPDELTAQKSALMLYDSEYAADRTAAEAHLADLERTLAENDLPGLRALLDGAPLAQWLSLIFLDGQKLKRELAPRIENADEKCRAAFAEAADGALRQLVAFRDLLDTLRKYC